MNDANTMCNTDGDLISDIATRLQYWILCGDVHLQTLAVMACCNLSLVQSQRSVLAETGIFDSVFRTSLAYFLSHTFLNT